MPRKPKTHIEAALAFQKKEEKQAREAKRKSRRITQQVLPHTARPKKPKKTKWVQLTIDHAIQVFNERERHAELSAYELGAVAQNRGADAGGQAPSSGEACCESAFGREESRQVANG